MAFDKEQNVSCKVANAAELTNNGRLVLFKKKTNVPSILQCEYKNT